MKTLTPYLNFFGACEEALNFYASCFHGKICSKMYFKDSPTPVPQALENKIMHAEFKAEGIYFMATDGMQNQSPSNIKNIALSIGLDSKQEQVQLFKKLSEGGEVLFDLQDTFWGAHFGMVKDKYGIEWMFNCPFEASNI